MNKSLVKQFREFFKNNVADDYVVTERDVEMLKLVNKEIDKILGYKNE